MRVLTVPDIHLKPEIIRLATQVARAHKPDKIVFTGDYFDDWGAGLPDYLETISALEDFKLEFGYRAAFLWGNHEYSYIAERPCSGYLPRAADLICGFLAKFQMQMAYQVDGYLWTHAGITSAWYKKWLMPWVKDAGTKPDDYLATDINATRLSLEDPGDEMWFSAGTERGGTGIPSILWADQKELMADPLPSSIVKCQIVGHTPLREIEEINNADDGKLIFFDVFSNDNEYDELLLIDTQNGEIRLVDKCPGRRGK